MVDEQIKLGTAIIWAIIVFIVTAIIEGLITIFLFKKMGGCPMHKEEWKKEAKHA